MLFKHAGSLVRSPAHIKLGLVTKWPLQLGSRGRKIIIQGHTLQHIEFVANLGYVRQSQKRVREGGKNAYYFSVGL